MKSPNFVCLVLCATIMAQAAGSVTVLGLPLGGQLKQPLPRCHPRRADPTVICQSGPPIVTTKQARKLEINVPGAGQRPKWAAYANFYAWVASDGTLSTLEVRTLQDGAFVEILNSITGRFGQSQKESQPGALIQTAEWTRSDVHIRLLCSPRVGCSTTFISASQDAADRRELAERQAKDAARSPVP